MSPFEDTPLQDSAALLPSSVDLNNSDNEGLGPVSSHPPFDPTTTTLSDFIATNAVASSGAHTHLSKPLWYLAYGSNLSSSVFRGRRGIKPLAYKNVIVHGLELTFNLAGLPFWEPRFANCRFAKDSEEKHHVRERDVMMDLEMDGPGDGPVVEKLVELDEEPEFEFELVGGQNGPSLHRHVHVPDPWTGVGSLIGVAYLVTPKDFATIVATEGGGTSYKMVAVKAAVLGAGEEDEKGSPPTPEVLEVFTLLASGVDRTSRSGGRPSLRYLNLLRTGAKEHALPTQYIQYLHALQPFKRTTLRQTTGAILYVIIIVPFFVPIVLGARLFADKEGKIPPWLSSLQRGFGMVMWGGYDLFWKHLFGDGEGLDEGSEL